MEGQMGLDLPMVSVLMPVRNEVGHIAGTLQALLKQDYPADRIEFIFIDGMSNDGTRQILQEWVSDVPRSRLCDNPGLIVPKALNIGLRGARAELIVIVNARCEYPPDYVRRVVALLQRSGADCAGGVLIPLGATLKQKAIGAAMQLPLGTGEGMRLHGETKGERRLREASTVHGGCWRKQLLLGAGEFDERLVRDSDDEMSFRLRKAGARIVQSTGIRIGYHVRETYCKLFLQFLQYGYWKVHVVRQHPCQSSLRHYIPAAFVFLVTMLALTSWAVPQAGWVLLLCLAAYLSANSLAAAVGAARSGWGLWPGILVSLLAMQIGYGLGFLFGVVRSLTGPLPSDAYFERLSR
jgi:succinoglycan biosynthesis protein ExoA